LSVTAVAKGSSVIAQKYEKSAAKPNRPRLICQRQCGVAMATPRIPMMHAMMISDRKLR